MAVVPSSLLVAVGSGVADGVEVGCTGARLGVEEGSSIAVGSTRDGTDVAGTAVSGTTVVGLGTAAVKVAKMF
jgi:hypothetical protein